MNGYALPLRTNDLTARVDAKMAGMDKEKSQSMNFPKLVSPRRDIVLG